MAITFIKEVMECFNKIHFGQKDINDHGYKANSLYHIPCFYLQVVIDRHPVRFFVHKRPHVDFFLDIVSIPKERQEGVTNNLFKKNQFLNLFMEDLEMCRNT